MVNSVFNATEVTKLLLYNCIKVVKLKPTKLSQWLQAWHEVI